MFGEVQLIEDKKKVHLLNAEKLRLTAFTCVFVILSVNAFMVKIYYSTCFPFL